MAIEPTAALPAYLLGAGDQITITVFGYEEYTGAKVVLPDGTIALPLLGSVMAAGQTPDGLAQDLTARLQPFLVDPAVTVSLNSLRPVVINVAGEVQRPGPLQLRSLTNTTANVGSNVNGNGTPSAASTGIPTVSLALVQAGGVTNDADIRQVVVRRSLPGGQVSTVTVNLWDSIWSDAAPQDLVLQAGDSIYVPRLAADDPSNRRLLARSSFAPTTIRVRVVGQVKAPGQVEVSPDSSISSAVAIAGGPTVDARLSAVELIRLNPDGTLSSQQIDLRDFDDSYQVQEGDVVVVPEQGSSSFLRGLGRVLSPIGALLGIFGRF
jgi:polysaccharide biosynthesis/export protein